MAESAWVMRESQKVETQSQIDLEKHRQSGISSEVVDCVIRGILKELVRGIKSEKKYEAVTKAANPNVRNEDVVCESVKLDAGVFMNWLERELVASNLGVDEDEGGFRHISGNIAG